MRKKLIGALLAGTCTFVGLGAIASGAQAAEEVEAISGTCHLVADVYRSGSYAAFRGGRVGCAASATVDVYAKRQKVGPDQQLDSRRFDTRDRTETIKVWGTSSHKYYTLTRSSTGSNLQSNVMTF